MHMKPIQCRLARTALNWSAERLAAAANVAVNTVTKFERGGDARVSTVEAMKGALENAGVIFIQADRDGGPGVRLRGS